MSEVAFFYQVMAIKLEKYRNYGNYMILNIKK